MVDPVGKVPQDIAHMKSIRPAQCRHDAIDRLNHFKNGIDGVGFLDVEACLIERDRIRQHRDTGSACIRERCSRICAPVQPSRLEPGVSGNGRGNSPARILSLVDCQPVPKIAGLCVVG
jgi:hypothetical protein